MVRKVEVENVYAGSGSCLFQNYCLLVIFFFFIKALESRGKDFSQSGHEGVMYIMGNTWL